MMVIGTMWRKRPVGVKVFDFPALKKRGCPYIYAVQPRSLRIFVSAGESDKGLSRNRMIDWIGSGGGYIVAEGSRRGIGELKEAREVRKESERFSAEYTALSTESRRSDRSGAEEALCRAEECRAPSGV